MCHRINAAWFDEPLEIIRRHHDLEPDDEPSDDMPEEAAGESEYEPLEMKRAA